MHIPVVYRLRSTTTTDPYIPQGSSYYQIKDWPPIHNLQIKYGEVWELIWEGTDNVSSILNQILDCQIISDTIIVDINIVKSIVRWADRRRRQVF